MNAFINTPVVATPDAPVAFQGLNSVSRGCWQTNGGWLFATQAAGTFRLSKPGRYLAIFNAQVTAAAAGPVTLTLIANGVAIPGTAMGETIAAANDVAQIGTATEITVTPYDTQTITITNTGDADVTINAASLVLIRIG